MSGAGMILKTLCLIMVLLGERSFRDMLRGFAFLVGLDIHNGLVVDKTKKCMKFLNPSLSLTSNSLAEEF
jgi:uncharacterized membrane protein